MTFDDKHLIEINELSRRLNVPKGTLYNWVYLRRIPFVKLGRALRFDPNEIGRIVRLSSTLEKAGGRWKEQENGPLPTRPDLVCRLLRQR
jgi:excisionase family DNA binding protein